RTRPARRRLARHTSEGVTMKAVAVLPGKPHSAHLADLPKPSLADVPGGRGVLVKILRVGVDGTDKEINAAEYGAAPTGSTFLVIGHEGFGRVEAVGPNVTEVQPGDYVVATVRRPGTSLYDLIGTNDMTTDDIYLERGINLRHGFLTEYYVDDAEFIVKVPPGLREVGVLLEPLTVVEKGIAHTAHHRAEQTTLLRLRGRQVGSVYGPSVDPGGLPANGARTIYPYPNIDALIAGESGGEGKTVLPGPGRLPSTERPPRA